MRTTAPPRGGAVAFSSSRATGREAVFQRRRLRVDSPRGRFPLLMRHPSGFTRTLRSLIAFLAVWCLGCSAYDPLIAALVPASGGRAMVCASDEGVETASVARSGNGDERSIGAPASERDGQ